MAAKKKADTPLQIMEGLKAKCTNDPAKVPVDGTIEDEIYVLSAKVGELTSLVHNLDHIISDLAENLNISRQQNFAAMDIIATLLGVPNEAFVIAFENVMVYDQKPRTDVQAHILSRQQSLLRRFEKVGVCNE